MNDPAVTLSPGTTTAVPRGLSTPALSRLAPTATVPSESDGDPRSVLVVRAEPRDRVDHDVASNRQLVDCQAEADVERRRAHVIEQNGAAGIARRQIDRADAARDVEVGAVADDRVATADISAAPGAGLGA